MTRAPESLLEKIPAALTFPLRGAGLLTSAMVALVAGVLSFLGFYSHLLQIGILFAFVNNIIRHAAQGGRDVPALTDFSDLVDDIWLPCLRGLAALGMVFLPLFLVVGTAQGWSALTSIDAFKNPLAMGLLALGFSYLPVALAVAAINQNLFHVINPLVGIHLILKAVKDYSLLLASFVGLVLFYVLVRTALLRAISGWTADLLLFLIRFYGYLVAAHLTGMWVYINRETYDYGMETTPAALADLPLPDKYPRHHSDPLVDELINAETLLAQGAIDEGKKILLDLYRRFPEDARPAQALLPLAYQSGDAASEVGLYAGHLIEHLIKQRNLEAAVKIYDDTTRFGLQARFSIACLQRLGGELRRAHKPVMALKVYLQMAYLFPQDQRSVRGLLTAAQIYLENLKEPRTALALLKLLHAAHKRSELGPEIFDKLMAVEAVAQEPPPADDHA